MVTSYHYCYTRRLASRGRLTPAYYTMDSPEREKEKEEYATASPRTTEQPAEEEEEDVLRPPPSEAVEPSDEITTRLPPAAATGSEESASVESVRLPRPPPPTPSSSYRSPGRRRTTTRVVDLESALLGAARPVLWATSGSSSRPDDDDNNSHKDEREYLTPPSDEARDDDGAAPLPRRAWVTFRVCHTGDAATLAALYCQAANNNNTPARLEDSPPLRPRTRSDSTAAAPTEEQISMWLAEGLGDEDRPPSVFGLLAEVHHGPPMDQDDATKEGTDQGSPGSNNGNSNNSSTLGAAVLLTTAWQDNRRVLRVEWYHLAAPFAPQLAGHVWLRLATLAVWTDAALVWIQPLLPEMQATKTTTLPGRTTTTDAPGTSPNETVDPPQSVT
jgi:hypothetical protein